MRVNLGLCPPIIGAYQLLIQGRVRLHRDPATVITRADAEDILKIPIKTSDGIKARIARYTQDTLVACAEQYTGLINSYKIYIAKR